MNTEFRFALVGRNVSYSKSAEIFEAIFNLARVQGRFDVYDVARPELESRMRQLALDGTRGFSVTIPHKAAVIDFLDDIDPVARTLGAVNSVGVDGGHLLGYNTDCYGFSIPLMPYMDKLKHKRALILGCGGAAKAVLYSLYVDLEVRAFTVAGRSQTKLDNFAATLEDRLERIQIEKAPLQFLSSQGRPPFDLVVNCTPLGGWNHLDASPLPAGFDMKRCRIYYDLNYNRENRIIQSAREAGVITIDGLAMLVGQAVRSFDIWTGLTVPFAQVYDAVLNSSKE